jgi:hypothetical protein
MSSTVTQRASLRFDRNGPEDAQTIGLVPSFARYKSSLHARMVRAS